MKPKYNKLAIIIAVFILIFNIFDSTFTHYLLKRNMAIELNPIMDYFIKNFGYVWLHIIKITVSSIFGFLISRYWNEYALARISAICIFFIYFALIVYYVVSIALYV